LILVGFAVDAKLHFVFVEGEFNRGMDGNDDGVGGLHLPDVVVGGDGADDVFLAKDRDGHFLLHLGAAGHGIFGDDRAQLGFVASLDDHRSGQDDGGEEEWFLHGCLLESVDSPVASSVREPVGGKLVRGCSGALKVNAEKEASGVAHPFAPFAKGWARVAQTINPETILGAAYADFAYAGVHFGRSGCGGFDSKSVDRLSSFQDLASSRRARSFFSAPLYASLPSNSRNGGFCSCVSRTIA
jgi:hypothetical protein